MDRRHPPPRSDLFRHSLIFRCAVHAVVCGGGGELRTLLGGLRREQGSEALALSLEVTPGEGGWKYSLVLLRLNQIIGHEVVSKTCICIANHFIKFGIRSKFITIKLEYTVYLA